MGKGTAIQGPVQFDYGVNTVFGTNCFVNFNLVVLDCCPVIIGNDVLMGPNCTLATPIHPMLIEERKVKFKEDGTPYDEEYAAPINIEDGCWLASNVTVVWWRYHRKRCHYWSRKCGYQRYSGRSVCSR